MRLLAFPTAIAIIVLTGLVHGDLSGRWGASQELQEAVARLDAIPSAIGDWRATDLELDPRQVEIGEIAGYVARRYENPAGAGFTVMLVCGRPGPIAAHTPEWCYGGAGYEAEGSPSAETLDLNEKKLAAFWVNVFRKERAAIPEVLEICWAWNAGGKWQAPENARVAFAPDRVLYKLYVVRDASADSDRGEEQAVRREFIRELMPGIDSSLFGRDEA
jgi:hypothetical protein